jgi:hypothetical protein
MKFEGYRAKKETEPAIDTDIFVRLQKYKVSAVEGTRPDPESLEDQKEKFLKGEIESPQFSYSKVKEKDYETKESGLLTLKEDLQKDESLPESLVQTYVWTINERIAKLRMLRELQKALNGGEAQYHMKRFSRYSEFVYGKPEADIYEGVRKSLYVKLQEARANLSSEKTDAFERLMAFASETEISETQQNEGEEITSIEKIKEYFEEAIQEMGLQNEWIVEIDKKNERQNFAVSLSKKKVLLPAEEKLKLRTEEGKLTLQKIRGLIVHELGTHALRNHNGSRSKLQLLSVGMDRYEVGEEGLATYRDQQETGKSDYAGFDNYFAASLAKGLDGGGERTFAQVFKILLDYYLVCDNADFNKARELAWKKCVRIFRGTTGDVPGVIFTKDIIYRKGNIATYKLMEKEGAEKIDFNVGKFDPANPRHVAVLIEFGILDKDLEMLAKG